MSGDRLTPLQWRILRALASLEPAWTLTGGAALAGVHLKHRTTRDLDLFWRQRKELGAIPKAVEAMLGNEGLVVRVVQSAPAFCRLNVGEAGETCIVDLVAEPGAALDRPLTVAHSGTTIAVDTSHEILVTKLCTLLSRSELRDLVDVQALLEAGGDLGRALVDAPRKDAGFSSLTLSWVLKGTPVHTMARVQGWGQEEADALDRFKESLIQRLLAASAPE